MLTWHPGRATEPLLVKSPRTAAPNTPADTELGTRRRDVPSVSASVRSTHRTGVADVQPCLTDRSRAAEDTGRRTCGRRDIGFAGGRLGGVPAPVSETRAARMPGPAAAGGGPSRPAGIMKHRPHVSVGVRSGPRWLGSGIGVSDRQDTRAQRPRRPASSRRPSAPRGDRSHEHGPPTLSAGMVRE